MRIRGKTVFSLLIAILMVLFFSMPLTAEEAEPQPADTEENSEPAPDEPPDEPAEGEEDPEEEKDPEDLEEVGIGNILPEERDAISSPVMDTFLFTGAATSKIPIIVPPGRGDIAPNLSLSYNSYAKNGWLGVGWSMDMGSIQRATKHGLCYDCDDYVANANGSTSELVRWTAWDEGGKEAYRSRIEGSFSKYYYNPSNNSWEVITKNGIRYYYGSRSDTNSKQTNTHGTFKWCLDWVEDPNGNYMTVAYTKDQGQIYLYEIEYTGNTNAPVLLPSNSVKFYLENRSDAPAVFHTHSEVVTAKRLKSIEVRSYEGRVRAYELTYGESGGTFRSLLESVRQYGSDAVFDAYGTVISGTSLPAVTFEWQEGTNEFGGMTRWINNTTVNQNRARWGTSYSDFTALIDMNGDMLPDQVHHKNYTTGEHGLWVAINNGNNGFDPMESWATYTTQPAQNRPRWGDEDGDYTVLMDMNG
ncbi:MAG: hypothetical protein GY864_08905, partial [Desulfobacterales bacterium]|nr:hypothetical protein [Desulfobacterales bacterium]